MVIEGSAYSRNTPLSGAERETSKNLIEKLRKKKKNKARKEKERKRMPK